MMVLVVLLVAARSTVRPIKATVTEIRHGAFLKWIFSGVQINATIFEQDWTVVNAAY